MSKPRRPIVAGNWKMHKTVGEAVDLAAAVKRGVGEDNDVDVVLCPPFTALKSVGDLLGFCNVKLGAQNVHWEASGAFTGEVSVGMLRDLGCGYVIVGHSERRTLFGDTDEHVQRKTRAALDGGLCPIVCVGETLQARESEQTEVVLARQIERGLGDLGERLAGIVIAYEPVWAIGTGRTASAAQVQAAHAFIRGRLARLTGDVVARKVRIQYGGSVKPDNAAELFALPDVDGGLIGGAALASDAFLAIVEAGL